ncbi:noggin-like [Hippoglossus hippoglossus]|uniref:noggin-like n=1 Tax=Hippoglossus hippoglossus TaxID=8267 RepID=UPI00148DF1A3|nr:noggin-like [Hippoglossus hippoglossus]
MLRASLLSFSQPMRPYTLLTNMEDYQDMPKPRHRRPSRLPRLLGRSFHPFWTSIEKPPEATEGDGDRRLLLHGDTPPGKSPTNLNPPPELKEAAANHHHKLEKEAAGLDLGPVPPDVASSVRSWLLRSATCELTYQWKDLSPAFWPRWLRQTDCERSDQVRSCSFPSGMECVRPQTAHIKILAWHCLEIRDRGDGSRKIKSKRYNGSAEVGTSEAMKSCLWRKVSSPVVTACTCSCK